MLSLSPRTSLIFLGLFLISAFPLLLSPWQGLTVAGLNMGLLTVITSPLLAAGLFAQGALSCRMGENAQERLILIASSWLVVLVSLCSRLPHHGLLSPHIVQIVAILGFGWMARSMPNGRFVLYGLVSLFFTLVLKPVPDVWSEMTDAHFLLIGAMLATTLLLIAGLAVGLIITPWLPERRQA